MNRLLGGVNFPSVSLAEISGFFRQRLQELARPWIGRGPCPSGKCLVVGAIRSPDEIRGDRHGGDK
jgi:hypothetical protein